MRKLAVAQPLQQAAWSKKRNRTDFECRVQAVLGAFLLV